MVDNSNMADANSALDSLGSDEMQLDDGTDGENEESGGEPTSGDEYSPEYTHQQTQTVDSLDSHHEILPAGMNANDEEAQQPTNVEIAGVNQQALLGNLLQYLQPVQAVNHPITFGGDSSTIFNSGMNGFYHAGPGMGKSYCDIRSRIKHYNVSIHIKRSSRLYYQAPNPMTLL